MSRKPARLRWHILRGPLIRQVFHLSHCLHRFARRARAHRCRERFRREGHVKLHARRGSEEIVRIVTALQFRQAGRVRTVG